mmetsp:Transcript_47999/g.114083  ORF Transcript_47999/g.114083 Transcript_47999/m.114083 type:complete len:240 (+) Transcript_47999:495-1214(+)
MAIGMLGPANRADKGIARFCRGRAPRSLVGTPRQHRCWVLGQSLEPGPSQLRTGTGRQCISRGRCNQELPTPHRILDSAAGDNAHQTTGPGTDMSLCCHPNARGARCKVVVLDCKPQSGHPADWQRSGMWRLLRCPSRHARLVRPGCLVREARLLRLDCCHKALRHTCMSGSRDRTSRRLGKGRTLREQMHKQGHSNQPHMSIDHPHTGHDRCMSGRDTPSAWRSLAQSSLDCTGMSRG